MITKEIVIDKIEVLEDGTLQVRQATRIMEDGVQLSQTYHRHCLPPATDLTGQDSRVISIAEATWTPEVTQAYQDNLPAG